LVIRGHGIDKNLEGRLVLQAAGLLEREYPLHPAAAFIGEIPPSVKDLLKLGRASFEILVPSRNGW
jgi:hypothetical protein